MQVIICVAALSNNGQAGRARQQSGGGDHDLWLWLFTPDALQLPHSHFPRLRSTIKTFDSGYGSSESQPQPGSFSGVSDTPGSEIVSGAHGDSRYDPPFGDVIAASSRKASKFASPEEVCKSMLKLVPRRDGVCISPGHQNVYAPRPGRDWSENIYKEDVTSRVQMS
ncbi:hypothetical protein F5887DRAFT_444127 [Amanita rubescens]|nr:hypothetical protein F5887DRAFT_444127 [Amanita rubescens]